MEISSPPESLGASSLASSPSRSGFEEHELYEIDSINDLPQKNDQSGPSFAQMLLNKNSKLATSCTWPSMNRQDLSRGSGTSGKSQQVKNTTDEWENVPTSSQSFGDVLAQALEASVSFDESPPSKIKAKNKKKRGKSTLLFASGMSRAD